jgi:hypothetical protein
MHHLSIALIYVGWLVSAHPFFISLTEIRQNPSSKNLEVAQKIFWDDLEVSLSAYHKESFDILNPKDEKTLNSKIGSYLTSHFEIWVDGKRVSLNYLGFEVEEEAIWAYYESNPVSISSQIEVRNSILLQETDSQQNIVHMYFPGNSTPRSLLLGIGEERGVLKIKK